MVELLTKMVLIRRVESFLLWEKEGSGCGNCARVDLRLT